MNYIKDFCQLYGADGNNVPDLIEKQKQIFGFSLFILHKKNLDDALKLGMEESKNIFNNQRLIFQIPHSYIFGGMFLGVILAILHLRFLFLPIVLGLMYYFFVSKIWKLIKTKVDLLLATRTFFNIDISQAQKIQSNFFQVKPIGETIKIKYTSNGRPADINALNEKIFLYLFAQPFIFGHLQIFGQIPFKTLLVFDLLIFLIVFGYFEKIIFWLAKIYYHFYFYLIDRYPIHFGKQKEDFFYDLYKYGMKTIDNLKSYEISISRLKQGIVDKDFGNSFEKSIDGIYKIFSLIKSNSQFFGQNPKFLIFLKNLINEILYSYLQSFEFLENMLLQEKHRICDLKNSSPQNEFINILTNRVLEKQKKDFSNIKYQLESLKV